MTQTTAADIISNIIAEGADSLLSIKYVLEDGAALKGLGLSDDSSLEIEEAHALIVSLMKLSA
jgi:hypothetical protein